MRKPVIPRSRSIGIVGCGIVRLSLLSSKAIHGRRKSLEIRRNFIEVSATPIVEVANLIKSGVQSVGWRYKCCRGKVQAQVRDAWVEGGWSVRTRELGRA